MRLKFLTPPPDKVLHPSTSAPRVGLFQRLFGPKDNNQNNNTSISIMDLFQPIPDELMPDVVASEDDTEDGSADGTALEMEPEPTEVVEEDDQSYEADDEREPTKKVTFYQQVKVKEIPHHRSYSDEIREMMWNSTEITQKNMQRNSIEFLVDGWDWQGATEEDKFLELNGQLVHPATWMRSAPVHISPPSSRNRRSTKSQQRYHHSPPQDRAPAATMTQWNQNLDERWS